MFRGEQKRRVMKLLSNLPAIVYLFLLFYIPLAILLAISFTVPAKFKVIWEFTLENHIRVFTDPRFYMPIINTFFIVTAATIALIIVGFPIAYYLARIKPDLGMKLIFFLIIPVEVNYLIRIYAWRVILGENGFINSLLLSLGIIEEPLTFLFYSWVAVVIVLIHEWLPYVVIPFYVNLVGIPRELYEAAMDLGANRLQVFRTVTLPLVKPALLTVMFIVFIPSLGEFAIPALVGGQSGVMIGVLIDRYLSDFRLAMGAALSFFLLIVTLGLSLLMIRIFGYESLYQR